MNKQIRRAILSTGFLLLLVPDARAVDQKEGVFTGTALTLEQQVAEAEKATLLACQTAVEKSVGPMTPAWDGPNARGVWAEYYCASVTQCLKNSNYRFYDWPPSLHCEQCITTSCWTGAKIVELSDFLLTPQSVWDFDKDCKLAAGNTCSQFN